MSEILKVFIGKLAHESSHNHLVLEDVDVGYDDATVRYIWYDNGVTVRYYYGGTVRYYDGAGTVRYYNAAIVDTIVVLL